MDMDFMKDADYAYIAGAIYEGYWDDVCVVTPDEILRFALPSEEGDLVMLYVLQNWERSSDNRVWENTSRTSY